MQKITFLLKISTEVIIFITKIILFMDIPSDLSIVKKTGRMTLEN